MHSLGIAYGLNMGYIYNMTKKGLYKVISVSLPEGLYKILIELGEHFHVSHSEVIRRGLETQKEIMLKQKFGYKGADIAKAKLSKDAMKEDRENKIAWLRAASGPEILQFLLETGYIETDQFEQGAKLVRMVVEPNDAGVMALRQHFHDKDSGVFSYPSDLQPLEEVIRGLIKEKKI